MTTEKNERFYLDYNATSPLSSNVEKLLASGDFLFANPSSQHTSGKQASRLITNTQNAIFKHFNISQKEFNLYFHSGATEAMNTFFNLKKNDCFFYFKSDHPCVHAIAKKLKSVGVTTKELSISSDGSIDLDECIAEILKVKLSDNSWLNYTFMHNETGVIWSLEDAQKIQKSTGIKVHVDAVQSVGKADRYNDLLSELDGYSYSGHKFGSLKGVGFSFYKKAIKLTPLVLGGGQQDGLRSGTINIHGIQTLSIALLDFEKKYEFFELKKFKEEIVQTFNANSEIEIIKNESANTICLIHKKLKADIMLIHFDLMGLDVSSGSACSSGSVNPSNTLLAMGYAEKAANNIRISIGAANIIQQDKIIKKLQQVAAKL